VARAAAEQEAAELLAELRRLPKSEQAVLALIGWEGLSAAEAAVALGVPEAAVRSRLHRARRRLPSLTKPDISPPNPQPAVSIDERTGL
jgi:DNA-directed RNA polymerase specialized sigma24 family protein